MDFRAAKQQARIEVRGVVQGVGFRPFVYRIATELGVDGMVGNDPAAVFVDVLATQAQLDAIVHAIGAEPPPLARVESVQILPAERSIESGSGFVIATSDRGDATGRTFVSPDTAVCDACVEEMFDPSDRRHQHPFITCTDCGPRFTITKALPYDRSSTTMADFEMCSLCRGEYQDPSDRRFHAQPIGCHDCGPSLRWCTPLGEGVPAVDPIERSRSLLGANRIVAVKGLGGFHLMASATSDDAVALLRLRKHRPDKPFAVMVADLEAAQELAHISAEEAALLLSPERPIVLCAARPGSPLSASVAPANPLIGIVLPYTPVHHLLFGGGPEGPTLGPMVMTSGNVGGEPICHRDDDVVQRIGHLVDGILTHNRPIHVPCDDSVVRVTERGLMPIRRARGYAPMPLVIPVEDDVEMMPSVLAVGGELKNAFCLTSGRHAWMSQHIGDMENLETLEAFEASVEQFCQLYSIAPHAVAADTHPAYRSSGWARTNHDDRVVEVQHHHAHAAAVMAEHGLVPSDPVLGVVFDGTGDGADGTIWGGELLVVTATHFERVGHLRPVPLPGGDAAIRHPWRVALSHLRQAGLEWHGTRSACAATPTERALLAQQLERDLGCVPTSSMGRFIDALASLTGLRHDISYEAQAAIEFEILATNWEGPTPKFDFSLADPRPLLVGVCEAVRTGVAPGAIARGCHVAIADGVAVEVQDHAACRKIETIVLSGGVFQNVLLTDLLAARLEAAGLEVLTHRLVPPNDGGLALGQAFIAASRAALHRRATSHSFESQQSTQRTGA